MISHLKFTGHLERVVQKDCDHILISVVNTHQGRKRRIMATVAQGETLGDVYDQVEGLIGCMVVVEGSVSQIGHPVIQVEDLLQGRIMI